MPSRKSDRRGNGNVSCRGHICIWLVHAETGWHVGGRVRWITERNVPRFKGGPATEPELSFPRCGRRVWCPKAPPLRRAPGAEIEHLLHPGHWHGPFRDAPLHLCAVKPIIFFTKLLAALGKGKFGIRRAKKQHSTPCLCASPTNQQGKLANPTNTKIGLSEQSFSHNRAIHNSD